MEKHSRFRLTRAGLPCAARLVLGLCLTPLAAQAQTYTDLHDFNINAGDPFTFVNGRLAQGRDGNFYAESNQGGAFLKGTVFQLTPGGTVTIIHSFAGSPDGQFPEGGMTLGPDGNFYGDAPTGGTASHGTVFKVTPSGTLTLLHTFTKKGDGTNPMYALVLNPNGNFYGATSQGNNSVPETIFQVTPSGTFKTIRTLTTAQGFSGGQLSQGSDGNIYGGTNAGGANGFGTAFKVTPGGVVTVLHDFNGTDGASAAFGLVQAPNGTFYGATKGGGSANAGVIYSLTSSGTFTVLHNLNGTSDGSTPFGQLLLASDGNLYGTAVSGGTSFVNCGTIFKVTPDGAYSVVHNFDRTSGCNPEEQPIQGTDGLLYGLVTGGGNHDGRGGVFYSLDLGLPAFAGLVTTAAAEGAKVGILGQGFSGTSVVKFGGVQATAISVTGITFINATVPAGALTGPVTVTTGSTTLTSTQTFQVKPTITSVAPANGPVGTSVNISGTGLTQATKLTFNGTSATFTVNSDTQIATTVPNGATTGKIAVTTTGGRAVSAVNFSVN
jgi:uncharacterized repeat protein (TIGR03803 family)